MSENGKHHTSVELEAMHRAMRAAEEAAEARRAAKAKGQEPPEPLSTEDLVLLAEVEVETQDLPAVSLDDGHATIALEEPADVDLLVAELSAMIPDPDDEERDGDLVIVKQGVSPAPWYKEAAEEALPAALRGIAGPLDVKSMLTALLVEVGDVKRTNAMLMDMITRLEEKVDRTNRHLRDRRPL